MYGCDSINYNSDANTDDGSCYYEGCMSDWADNYDSLATQNTLVENECYRNCIIPFWADNYDSLATEDDGSCFRMGCTSVWAKFDDGSCIEYVYQGGYLFYIDAGEMA